MPLLPLPSVPSTEAAPTAPGAIASVVPPPAAGQAATRLRIPDLNVDLPVYEGDGMNAELGQAAHFPTTAWPGGGSLIYLYGHARDGSFIALWRAQPGQTVQLELADGSVATYTVTKVVPEVRWDDMSWVAPTEREVLRLQTCTSYGRTAPRFIVEAEPASEA